MARILIIAHRPMLRQALHRTIAAWRHDPLSTCDAMLGIELALTVRPDLVVVEHDGPVLDGGSIVHDLREVLRSECPRVLLISSAPSDARRPLSPLAARGTVLVRKPYRSSDLWDAVCRAMSRTMGSHRHGGDGRAVALHDGPRKEGTCQDWASC